MTEESASASPAEPEHAQLQRDVQRHLGRCLIRVQQYEHLLKAVLAAHKVAGTVHSAKVRQAEYTEDLSKATLGVLMNELFGSYLTVQGSSEGRPDELDEESSRTGLPTFRFEVRLEMSEAHFVETRAALQELVQLRNDLVHHFVQRFNLWSYDGCLAALSHVQTTYAHIDRHFEELRGWAKSLDEAKEATARFMQSPEYLDAVINGIAPDGTIAWPVAGIVGALRDAHEKLQQHDGWASLSAAIQWIALHHPEQAPQKYKCVSWPQVLHESRVFDLQYRESPDGGRMGWYRERAPRAT